MYCHKFLEQNNKILSAKTTKFLENKNILSAETIKFLEQNKTILSAVE